MGEIEYCGYSETGFPVLLKDAGNLVYCNTRVLVPGTSTRGVLEDVYSYSGIPGVLENSSTTLVLDREVTVAPSTFATPESRPRKSPGKNWAFL